MKFDGGSQEYFESRMLEPEFAKAYSIAARRISIFDTVIEDLDALREDSGLTKAELARRSGLPPAAVRRLFSQQHKNPTLTTLIAISDALEAVIAVQPDDPDRKLPSRRKQHPPRRKS